jgi:hypothetical protein
MTDHDAAGATLTAAAWRDLTARLARSRFRSRFRLNARDARYLAERDWPTIRSHARGFVDHRLAPAAPRNDERQTPMRGHPAFVAQHATATCCRGCLAKWHGVARGHTLDDRERDYIVAVVMAWLGSPPRDTDAPA